MFSCQKKKYIYTKNQDIDFFTYIKYIIYILQCNHIIVWWVCDYYL